jgi:hypothetical protein
MSLCSLDQNREPTLGVKVRDMEAMMVVKQAALFVQLR